MEPEGYQERINDDMIIALSQAIRATHKQDEYDDLVKNLVTMLDDGPRKDLHPIQTEFVKKLWEDRNKNNYTEQEKICISHCIKYNQYSDIHRDTLNHLIQKYT